MNGQLCIIALLFLAGLASAYEKEWAKHAVSFTIIDKVNESSQNFSCTFF